MKLKFNGGANQIGGNSVFISTQKTCLLLDAGIAVTGETKSILNIDNIDAVILSHSHIDHYGQLEDLPANIPVYCTEIAWRLIQSSRIFNKKPLFDHKVNFIKAYKEFSIGDLLIKPYPMDHSAPDSMAFLISDHTNRIFYTGDFRGHGRKEKCFQHLLKKPPQDIDLLIIEGTMLGRDADAISNEKSVEGKMAKCLKDNSSLPFFLSTSPQNIDRMVSCYRAAIQSKRILVLDIYSAWILRLFQTMSKNIPDISWDKIRVIANGLTASRHYGILKSNSDFFGEFTRELYKDENLLPLEELTKDSSRYFIKTSYIQDVAKKYKFENFGVIYSLWSGYIKDDSRLLSLQKSPHVHFVEIHSGGHASLEELQALIKAVKPAKIVSLHTEHAEMLSELTSKVQMVNSGNEINLKKLEDNMKFQDASKKYIELRDEIMDKSCKSCRRKNCRKNLILVPCDDHHSTPGTLKHDIKDVGEKAMQRAALALVPEGKIAPDASTSLKERTVTWVDMELPVVLSKESRRPCIDLIGISNDEKTVVCEIKFTEKSAYHSDCPIYAAMELLKYHFLIELNHDKLHSKKIRHQFKGKHPKDTEDKIWKNYNDNPILLVAANKSYWKYWNKKPNINVPEIFKNISDMAEIEIHPYSFEDMTFEIVDGEKHCPGKRHKEISEWSLIE